MWPDSGQCLFLVVKIKPPQPVVGVSQKVPPYHPHEFGGQPDICSTGFLADALSKGKLKNPAVGRYQPVQMASQGFAK